MRRPAGFICHRWHVARQPAARPGVPRHGKHEGTPTMSTSPLRSRMASVLLFALGSAIAESKASVLWHDGLSQFLRIGNSGAERFDDMC